MGGTAPSSPEAGLPFSPKASVDQKKGNQLSHFHFNCMYANQFGPITTNSHCGFTVRRTFSPFFIVFTAFDNAGQKKPKQNRHHISRLNLLNPKLGDRRRIPTIFYGELHPIRFRYNSSVLKSGLIFNCIEEKGKVIMGTSMINEK